MEFDIEKIDPEAQRNILAIWNKFSREQKQDIVCLLEMLVDAVMEVE